MLSYEERQTHSNCFNDSTSSDVSAQNVLDARIFGATMSALSMLGALLIILSYVAIKEIRTNARFILLHLSFGDFGVGLVNFLGAVIHFDDFILKACCENKTLPLSCNGYTGLCKTQAFFASLFTIASILWTLVLAIYVYVLVVHTNKVLSKALMNFSYVVCWGLPICVSVWFVLTNRLGSTRVGGGGWCSLKASDKDGNISKFTVLFGSDLWVMVTFFLILVLYSTTHCYLKVKMRDIERLYNVTKDQLGRHFSSDHKFLLIPLFFIILRVGSVVFSIVFVYTHLWHQMTHPWRLLVYYAMAIGDSSQGLVNGFIFCLLTPRVRQKLCCICRRSHAVAVTSPLTETAEQRKLLEKVDVSISGNASIHNSFSSSDTYD